MEDLFLKMNLLMIFVQNLTAAATIKKTTDLYVVELIVRRREKGVVIFSRHQEIGGKHQVPDAHIVSILS